MPLDNNHDSKLSPADEPARSDSQQMATAFELPIIIVAAIGVGGLMGYFLDHWLHTKPILMLVFGGLGFGVGVRDVLRRLK
jgi:F0F1-type ATP synthase assembly protein I